MSNDIDSNFNEKFMHINMKLKKRFLRKPNLTEAANEFLALAIQCEHCEQWSFAGHAYVGAAKCEASAGNPLGEAEHYVTAARQFMKAEKKLHSLKFYSPDREDLEAAIGCFIQALHKYPEKSQLRASILMELSNDLVFLNHKKEALAYYEQAMEYVTDSMAKLMCMRHKMNLAMDCGKHDVALETANTIMDSKFNIPLDILTEIQISRVLLTLLEKPADDKKPVSLRQLFTDLMNDNDSDLLPFNMELRLKLQSLVVTAWSGDTQNLVTVASELNKYLTPEQELLLHYLVVRERETQLALT